MLKSFIFKPEVRSCRASSCDGQRAAGSWVQAAARFLFLAPVRGHSPVNQEPQLVGSMAMAPY